MKHSQDNNKRQEGAVTRSKTYTILTETQKQNKPPSMMENFKEKKVSLLVQTKFSDTVLHKRNSLFSICSKQPILGPQNNFLVILEPNIALCLLLFTLDPDTL